MVEKNNEYIVDIIDNGYEGEGIAKIDGFTIFIPGAIKGEKIKILIREGIDDYCKNYNIEECDICRNVPKIEKLVDFLEQNPELRFLCGDRRTLFEITDKSLVPF